MSSRRKAGRDPLDSITIHIGDWRTSTTIARLGRYLESAYLELLMHQWLSEGEGLPADPEELRTIVRLTPAEWAKFWRLAEAKFPADPDGKRRNPRTHEEWQHCRDNRDGARRRASTGGRAKAAAQALLKQPASTGQAAPEQCLRPSPSPSPSLSSSVEEETSASAAPLTRHFTDARHADAYSRARRSHRSPVALDATLESMAQGMGGPGGKPLTWHQLGTAILEAQAAGRDLTPQTIRNFAVKVSPLALVPKPLEFDPPGTVRDGSGNIIQRRPA